MYNDNDSKIIGTRQLAHQDFSVILECIHDNNALQILGIHIKHQQYKLVSRIHSFDNIITVILCCPEQRAVRNSCCEIIKAYF